MKAILEPIHGSIEVVTDDGRAVCVRALGTGFKPLRPPSPCQRVALAAGRTRSASGDRLDLGTDPGQARRLALHPAG
jgi:hypothetical protein